MKSKLHLFAFLFLGAILSFNATAQISSGGPFEMTQSVIASGGGTSMDPRFQTTGAVGQSVTVNSGFPPFSLRSGLFTAPPLGPTAAAVTVSGRVLTFDRRGIPRAFVSVIDGNGSIRSTMTNQFGHFSFGNIEAGQTYVFSVAGKQIQFGQPSQVLFVSESLSDLYFVALP